MLSTYKRRRVGTEHPPPAEQESKNKRLFLPSLSTPGDVTPIYFVITRDALHFTASRLTVPRGTIQKC